MPREHARQRRAVREALARDPQLRAALDVAEGRAHGGHGVEEEVHEDGVAADGGEGEEHADPRVGGETDDALLRGAAGEQADLAVDSERVAADLRSECGGGGGGHGSLGLHRPPAGAGLRLKRLLPPPPPPLPG